MLTADFMQTTLDEMLSRQTVTESNNPDSSTPVGRPRTHGKAGVFVVNLFVANSL